MAANQQPSAVADDSGGAIPPCGPADGQNASVPTSSSETIQAMRRHLPDERRALTHHFSFAGQEGYLTVGMYEDGRPGELFITMAKEGSTISGLMDAFATAVSLALQHGVPLQVLCGKFTHMRFEPSGWSGNPKIGYAKSIIDYVFRWLELKFLNPEHGGLFQATLIGSPDASTGSATDDVTRALAEVIEFGDAPTCRTCGCLMSRSGSCYRCASCGSNTGCS